MSLFENNCNITSSIQIEAVFACFCRMPIRHSNVFAISVLRFTPKANVSTIMHQDHKYSLDSAMLELDPSLWGCPTRAIKTVAPRSIRTSSRCVDVQASNKKATATMLFEYLLGSNIDNLWLCVWYTVRIYTYILWIFPAPSISHYQDNYLF